MSFDPVPGIWPGDINVGGSRGYVAIFLGNRKYLNGIVPGRSFAYAVWKKETGRPRGVEQTSTWHFIEAVTGTFPCSLFYMMACQTAQFRRCSVLKSPLSLFFLFPLSPLFPRPVGNLNNSIVGTAAQEDVPTAFFVIVFKFVRLTTGGANWFVFITYVTHNARATWTANRPVHSRKCN